MRDDEKQAKFVAQCSAPQTTPGSSRIPLFVIRKLDQEQYWTCSSEHGSGWHPGNPRQSFSPSELATQVGLLAREFWNDIVIIQLRCV